MKHSYLFYLLLLVGLFGSLSTTMAEDVATINFPGMSGNTCFTGGPNTVTVLYSMEFHAPTGHLIRFDDSISGPSDSVGPMDHTLADGAWRNGAFPLDGNGIYWERITIFKGATDSSGIETGIYLSFNCTGLSIGLPSDMNSQPIAPSDPVTVQAVSGGVTVVAVTDGRINPRPDAGVAVYCQSDRVALYGIDAGGQGFPAMFIPYADLPQAASDANTLIEQFENIRFYRLTTGEFQVNVGPDAEGKEYVFIWDACPPSHIQTSSFEGNLN